MCKFTKVLSSFPVYLVHKQTVKLFYINVAPIYQVAGIGSDNTAFIQGKLTLPTSIIIIVRVICRICGNDNCSCCK